LNKPKKILVIIQRSNGDVFLSLSLINSLYYEFNSPKIDLLVNDDTKSVAQLFSNVNSIITFSYSRKQADRWGQEKEIINQINRKYDLSINLTASDRSVFYCLIASKFSISAIEKNSRKSWWKKMLLSHHYYFDVDKHILENNLTPLEFLSVKPNYIQETPAISKTVSNKIKDRLEKLKIDEFFIFHPNAQYSYKIYPKAQRDELLDKLLKIGLPIVITGSSNKIDINVKKQLPKSNLIYDFIGETSLEEYLALSDKSCAYIGMDTLNMHIAASQNKPIFAIFGPTKLSMWSPWSNQTKTAALMDYPIQTYGKNTIFQSSLACKICGVVGCGSIHGKSEFIYDINPLSIFNKINGWHLSLKNDIDNETENSIRKVVLYIVYGNDQAYYDGAVFSLMTFMHWCSEEDKIEFAVLTEKPNFFKEYPVKVLTMSEQQKTEWSINGQYHFRIKNRGFAYVMDELKLNSFDRILFFDTDTYFHKSPLPLFELIKPNQALFYLNEGLIYKRKRFKTYRDNLENKKIIVENEYYELSKKSAMWGSLMIGITGNMRPSLDWADKLLLSLFDLVPSHTIEPFALSESLLRRYRLVEGKGFVSLYSTSRKKEYAKQILSNFINKNKSLDFNKKVLLAQDVKIKRSFYIILKQRFLRLFK
jgi:heptosyltransferase III